MVQKLHEHGEGHGKIDISLRDVKIQPFGDQAHAYHDEKAESQHLDRGMGFDKLADPVHREHHDDDGDDDGQDHDADLQGHADGGDDRIERENEAKDHDLDDDKEKLPAAVVTLFSLRSFEALVDLERAFGQKKNPACQEDNIPAGDLLAER